MPNTTDTMPEPKPCEHCGKMLPIRTAKIAGHTVFAGWQPCDCSGALADQARWEEEHEAAMRASEDAAWERKIETSGIPPRYRDAAHPWAEHMANLVQEGKGFYLHGHNGVRKTMLASSAAILCIKRKMTVRFEVATKLLERLKGFGDDALLLADQLAKCDLLVIDDLGKEAAATPRAAEKLYDIFNDRYNAESKGIRKPVIVTSNYTRGEVAGRISEGGAGKAIASRLAAMTQPVLMESPDGKDGRIADGKNRHAADFPARLAG